MKTFPEATVSHTTINYIIINYRSIQQKQL